MLDTLCSLLVQLGSDFAIFVPTINKVSFLHRRASFVRAHKGVQALLRHRIPHPKYESLVSKLLNGERLPQELGTLEYMCVTFPGGEILTQKSL